MILYITVRPQKHRDQIEKRDAGWVISIKARPRDNEANEYLARYLAKILGLSVSAVQIKKGQNSRVKKIEILADEQTVLAQLDKAASR